MRTAAGCLRAHSAHAEHIIEPRLLMRSVEVAIPTPPRYKGCTDANSDVRYTDEPAVCIVNRRNGLDQKDGDVSLSNNEAGVEGWVNNPRAS